MPGTGYRDPETFNPVPLLATAWRYVDDTTLEFDLRKSVKFHDGSPFTAADVVFTFTQITADKRVTTRSNFAWMAGAEKIDDYKVRVKLKWNFPAAIEYITMVLPIIPKDYNEKIGAGDIRKRRSRPVPIASPKSLCRARSGRSGMDNPLTKEKVRQAIAYAINREEIAKKADAGRFAPDECALLPHPARLR
jgi:ABC-type transport system substrate-binding protein